MPRPCGRPSYCSAVAILGIVVWSLVGCETPSGSTEGAPTAEAEEAEPVRIPTPVRTHIVGARTPVALKIRPEQWHEIAPAVERLADALPLGPLLESGAESIHSEGLADYLTRTFAGFEAPDRLLGEGPIYVRFEVLGAERYRRAARIGLPIPSPQDGGAYPAASLVRVLFPADDAGALADAIERRVAIARRDVRTVVSTEGAFCRLDIVHRTGPDASRERIAEIVDRLRDETDRAPEELSPAVRRFVASESPVAALADLGDLKDWYLAQRGLAIGRSAARTDTAGRRSWVVQGSAVATALHLVTLRSARTIDEYVVELSGDGTGGFQLVGTGTRTVFGRHLQSSIAGAGELPALSVPGGSPQTLVADAAFGLDVAALEREAPGAVDVVGGDRAALRGADDILRVYRVAGAGTAVGLLHNPEHVARLAGAAGRDLVGVPLPSSARLRMVRVPGASDRPFRGTLHARFAFDETAPVSGDGGSRLGGLSSWFPEPTRAFDWETARQEGATERLTVQVGGSIEGVASGGATRSVSTGLALEAIPDRVVEALEQTSLDPRLVRALQGLQSLPSIRVATAGSPTLTRVRLRVGAGEPAPLDVASPEIELVERSGRVACLDRMTVALHKFKQTLPALAPANLDGAQRLVDRLARSFDACQGDSAVDPSYRKWALGRAAWLAGWRAEIALERRLEAGETDRRRIRRPRKAAAILYERACENGDAAGCRAREALPRAN